MTRRAAALGSGTFFAVASFVVGYEEPTLSEQFGAQYDVYRAAVPRRLPRLRAWR